MKLHASAALVALVLLAGCSGMKPGLGFDEVGRGVSERTGMKIHWDNGSPDDRKAHDAVAELLSRELTADEAVQVALLNNRDLQAVYEELHLAQADLVQAGLLRNPVFDAEVRFGEGGSGTGVELGVAQNFVSLFFIPLRKGRAAAAFEAAKLRVTGAVLDLAGEARTSFHDLQAAAQLVEMRGTVVEATRASYELAIRLREAGNNRELDVSNERALYEESKVELASAEALVVRERERMNELMGVWGEQMGWKVAPRLPALPDEEMGTEGLEARALERSLDLGIARREFEVAARSVGIAQPFAILGDADVGVAAEREIEGEWSVGPSLSLPIPLFDQGQGVVGSARAQLRQAAERYAAAGVRVRARVRAAHAAVGAARDRARYYEKVLLPLRERIVGETQLQYNAMQVGAFQLLQAKRDQIETGARYVESLRDYWVERARLDQILSGRLPQAERGGMDVRTTPMTRGSSREGGH